MCPWPCECRLIGKSETLPVKLGHEQAGQEGRAMAMLGTGNAGQPGQVRDGHLL
jgi:hypothetical protein